MNELNNLIDIEVDTIATNHPNYFPGQYLLAEDFNLQHQYLSDRLSYRNKSLHVSGIIEGLTVEKEGTNSVKITPGAAIDNQGNMIVLTEEKTFAEFNTINQGELYVKYIKHKDKQQQENVIDSYTRWQEIPQLVFADTTPETGVKLAKITLEEGAITKVVTDVREYSGLSLPTSNGTELTLRYGGTKEGINEAVLTGSLHINNNLTVDGKLGIGTNTPEANLHIHGELKLQEGVAVNKISGDDELTENSDQIIPTQKAIKTYADTKAELAGKATQDFNAQNLTVSKNHYVSGSIIPSAGNSETNGIMFPKNPGGGVRDAAWIRYYVRSGENTTLEIGTSNDYRDDHIALMTVGNVGIGTITPRAKLEIKGNLKLEEGVAVKNISNDESLQEESDEIIPTQKAIKTYADTKAELAGKATQDFNAQNLYISGSIEPSAGNSENNGIMFPRNPGGGGFDAAWIRYYARPDMGEATTLEIGTSDNRDDHIALMTEGNVGIGTINPGAKLEIKGNLKLEEGVAVKKISNDELLREESHEIIPTQKAIKKYIDDAIRNLREEFSENS